MDAKGELCSLVPREMGTKGAFPCEDSGLPGGEDIGTKAVIRRKECSLRQGSQDHKVYRP